MDKATSNKFIENYICWSTKTFGGSQTTTIINYKK